MHLLSDMASFSKYLYEISGRENIKSCMAVAVNLLLLRLGHRLDAFEGGSSSTGARFIDLKPLLFNKQWSFHWLFFWIRDQGWNTTQLYRGYN